MNNTFLGLFTTMSSLPFAARLNRRLFLKACYFPQQKRLIRGADRRKEAVSLAKRVVLSRYLCRSDCNVPTSQEITRIENLY